MDYLAAMRALVRSVELGSFSKAAIESGSKVSTVSRYISALEADLGAALFNRSTRRIQLTEAGRAFYDRAVAIVADVEDARRATSELNSKPRGLLRINLPGAFGRLRVVPALPGFLAAYPDIRVELGFSDSRVDLIETGTDVALRIGSLVDSSLKARRIASHRRLLCAGPGAMTDSVRPTSPEGLAASNCLASLPGEHWYFRSAGNTAKQAPGAVSIGGRLCTPDLQALRAAALGDLGVALLPEWLVADDLLSGGLVRLLPAWDFATSPDFEQSIWALYPPKKIVSPKVRMFIDYLQAQLNAGMPAHGESEPPRPKPARSRKAP